MRAFGLSTLYLVTDHTELYEHLGWEIHASACDIETGEELRVYRRILSDQVSSDASDSHYSANRLTRRIMRLLL